MKILHFINVGGFIMYPLIVCSVLVWAIIIEKFFYVFHFKKQSDVMFLKTKKLIMDGKIHEAKGLCHNVNELIAEIYSAVLVRDMSTEKWKNKIERAIDNMRLGLRRYLWLLATFATISPFLGLFGTVIGIMRSFELIAESGKSGFAVIAPGLAQALITTAAGILVATMALFFYNFFQAYLVKVTHRFRNNVEELVDLMEEFDVKKV